jgi:hypothetical protein
MAVDVDMIQHSDFLEFIVTGSFDLTDAINKFSYVIEACSQTGLDKVLIDFKGLEREDSATIKGLYAYGVENHYLEHLEAGGHELKIAYVGQIVMAWEPGMEVAEKNKLPFKLFNNLNDALEWLGVKGT